jgi:murein DD-endopeptidase MepM/ murein hydrolase activator NlpD
MKPRIYKPLKDNLITQNFGEDNVCIKPDGTIFPRLAPTCYGDSISLYKKFGLKGHNGIDFAAKDWETVFSSFEGIVTEVCTERERGLGVGITSVDKYEIAGGNYKIKIRYWHLAGMNVKLGDRVRVADILGWADNTGYSTGTHLHFEIKPVDDNENNVLQNNGYYGAVDPLPYLQLVSAYEISGVLYKIRILLANILTNVSDHLIKIQDAYTK